MLYVY